jgi:oxygen-independent coproporphyrinogen III oxidase
MPESMPSFAEIVAEAQKSLAAMPLAELSDLGILQPIENYYLVGTYPPLKAMDDITPAETFAGVTERANIYLHLPFCEQRCTFCHFAKEIRPGESRVTRYLSALHRELELVTGQLPHRVTAETVYFGGGTPSYLSADQIRALFGQLRRHIDIPDTAEITFELHPSVIEAPDYLDRLDALRDCGVNRWVFGVQSMDDRVLRKLNRGHEASHVYRLLDLLHERGLDNYSVDLIFGLPYQTEENWYTSLTSLMNYGVEKFNIFPLMFKQADPISAHYRNQPEIFPDLRRRLLMHFMTEALTRQLGFRRGPLFYYSKSATHSRQQENKYDSIEDTNLLPFGVSGFGYVGNTQYYNDPGMDGYMQRIESGRPSVWHGVHLPVDERMRRAIMFNLRSRGVGREDFRRRYGADPAEHFAAELAPYREHGLITIDDDAIRLTDRGVPVADSIALRLVSPQVLAKVQQANSRIVDLKRDPLDRYDFSPLERDPVGAGVSAAGRTALPLTVEL